MQSKQTQIFQKVFDQCCNAGPAPRSLCGGGAELQGPFSPIPSLKTPECGRRGPPPCTFQGSPLKFHYVTVFDKGGVGGHVAPLSREPFSSPRDQSYLTQITANKTLPKSVHGILALVLKLSQHDIKTICIYQSARSHKAMFCHNRPISVTVL